MSYGRKTVTHIPEWVQAPLRINREGETRPGYLCVHELENGNGWCGGNVFDLADADNEHACIILLRGRWKFSRPCYDKYHRCPGWAGGGWKSKGEKLCHRENGGGGYIQVDYQTRWWRWKTHKCDTCDVIVLPYIVRWTDWSTWWWDIKTARNKWMWLIRFETWWGKKRGWW